MALQQPDLAGAEVSLAASPSIMPERVAVCKFAAGAGGSAVTLPVGTPVCVHNSTNFWTVWADTAGAGTNKERVIRGFVYPLPVTITATGGAEVLGDVLLAGTINLACIKAALAALSITTTNLAAALRGPASGDPSLRELGITVQDLTLGHI